MLRCQGTLTLDSGDDAGVTVETVSGRLEVRVPLVSRSAERAIFGGFRRHLEVEAAAMADYCSRIR